MSQEEKEDLGKLANDLLKFCDEINFDDSGYIKPSFGIDTGIHDLDEMTNGLQGSDLIILASRPGVGKSSLALNLATNISLLGKMPVIYYGLGDTRKNILLKILCSESEISIHHFQAANIPKESMPIIINTIAKLENSKIYIQNKAGFGIGDVREYVEKIINSESSKPVLFIDSLQLLTSEKFYSETVRQLKFLAMEFDIPVILTSELSHWIEKRNNKRPQYGDLDSFGEMSMYPDMIWFLYRDEYYNPDSNRKKIAELTIAKHSRGPIGTVELFFDAKLTKFSGLER